MDLNVFTHIWNESLWLPGKTLLIHTIYTPGPKRRQTFYHNCTLKGESGKDSEGDWEVRLNHVQKKVKRMGSETTVSTSFQFHISHRVLTLFVNRKHLKNHYFLPFLNLRLKVSCIFNDIIFEWFYQKNVDTIVQNIKKDRFTKDRILSCLQWRVFRRTGRFSLHYQRRNSRKSSYVTCTLHSVLRPKEEKMFL